MSAGVCNEEVLCMWTTFSCCRPSVTGHYYCIICFLGWATTVPMSSAMISGNSCIKRYYIAFTGMLPGLSRERKFVQFLECVLLSLFVFDIYPPSARLVLVFPPSFLPFGFLLHACMPSCCSFVATLIAFVHSFILRLRILPIFICRFYVIYPLFEQTESSDIGSVLF